LKSHNLTLKDWKMELKTKNPKSAVYQLPDGELLLSPGTNEAKFPFFLFKDFESFDAMRQANYFPIPDSLKNEYELADEFLRKKDIPHFFTFFITELRLNYKAIDEDMLDTGYNALFKYVKVKNNPVLEKNRLVLAYTMIVMDYLEKKYNAQISFQEQYAEYNPILIPKLKINGHFVLIMESIWSSLERGDIKRAKEQYQSTLKKRIDNAINRQ